MNRSFLIIFFLSLCFVRIPSAVAESSEWAVVPATRGTMPAFMEVVVTDIAQELERQGRGTWSSRAAALRFENRNSVAARGLTNQALERWRRDSLAGIRHLAEGNPATALDSLERAERLSRSAGAELNRDPPRAERVLDTCLYMVRALLETDDDAGAMTRADECLRLVPNQEPAQLMHPPEVVSLFEDARVRAATEIGTLVVESSPSQCDVRVNGVRFGRTPLRTEQLASGEYAVQVECPGTRRGRIHRAKVASGTHSLFIDARFDRSVHTAPILRLEYPRGGEDRTRVAHAQEIAKALPASMVVLVSAPDRDGISIELVARGGTRQACARLAVTPNGPGAKALAMAISELIRGDCRSASALAPSPSRLFKPGI